MTAIGFYKRIEDELNQIKADGLWKAEREIVSPQGAVVRLADGEELLNFCANNYLGLADHPRLIEAAQEAMAAYGHGMSSVRFICGTTDLHRDLERAIAEYLGTDDSILFAACFDANGGVFEPLLGIDDAIISDSLNHASIIDGVRLCKARRYRYQTRDLDDLRAQLTKAASEGTGTSLIVTDGVFSMDGFVADLADIKALADEFGALVMVDDCHATGFIGPEGKGTAALAGVEVDIITSTLGKALGGAMGGFVAAKDDVVKLLRQRARPYLFSNALSPAHVGGALAAIELARSDDGDQRRQQLEANARQFRQAMTEAGFTLTGQGHPIIPVMIGDAVQAAAMAARMGELGVYVTAFSFPVVPREQARIRTQMSAAHSSDDVDRAVNAFIQARDELTP